MIRKRLIARRKEKERESLRYNRGDEDDEDEWMKVEDKEEVTEDKEEDKLSTSDERGEEGGEETLSSTLAKVWTLADREIYEQQLEHLHNQLAAALIDNGDLKRNNQELEKNNQELKTKLKSSKSDEKEAAAGKTKKYGSYRGSDLSTSTTGEGFESVSSQPTTSTPSSSSRPSSGYRLWWDKVKDALFEVLYDFTDDSPTDEEAVKETPLQAKLLKGNLKRLASSSKPYQELLKKMKRIKDWKNPSLTLVIFLTYMYCVWNGWIIQCLLLIAIIYLSLNYLQVIGLTEQFGFGSHSAKEDKDDSFENPHLFDQFQLMKHVGQKVQNTSETVSDNLEKGQNLLEWHHPQSTRYIYSILCVSFIATLFLPNSYTITIAGLGIGFKLFIVDTIYRKYPKVKDKYDRLARMWRSLPTHKELKDRQPLTEDELNSDGGSRLSSLTSTATASSISDTAFCERFQLSMEETPLENWSSGKRCTLLDKDRPLIGSKQGRLFLTHSFICFERSPRPGDSADRFTIALADIRKICKAKPFAVLPGSGMSIEVTAKQREKPYLFGAILHRDQAYLSICDQAMIIGLPWGSDLESSGRVALVARESTDGGGNTSLEEPPLVTESSEESRITIWSRL